MAEERGKTEKGSKGSMTVVEAGHRGGQRVRELIEEGKQAEGMETGRRRSEKR